MKTNLLKVTLFGFLLFSCASSDDNDNAEVADDNSEISNTLHMAFKTPDWERFINCEQLNLPPIESTNTFGVSATSASTNETFYFTYPKDSSALRNLGNLKRFAIAGYLENSQPFEFSQKLPVTDGSSDRLISVPGLSGDSYNEVVGIEYVGREPEYALFKVKCRYKMKTYLLSDPTKVKDVSGTFHFKIRTNRK